MAGARNPLRSDLRPEAVIRTARRVAASLVEVLPTADPGSGGTGRPAGDAEPSRHALASPALAAGSMAERLTGRLERGAERGARRAG